MGDCTGEIICKRTNKSKMPVEFLFRRHYLYLCIIAAGVESAFYREKLLVLLSLLISLFLFLISQSFTTSSKLRLERHISRQSFITLRQYALYSASSLNSAVISRPDSIASTFRSIFYISLIMRSFWYIILYISTIVNRQSII